MLPSIPLIPYPSFQAFLPLDSSMMKLPRKEGMITILSNRLAKEGVKDVVLRASLAIVMVAAVRMMAAKPTIAHVGVNQMIGASIKKLARRGRDAATAMQQPTNVVHLVWRRSIAPKNVNGSIGERNIKMLAVRNL